MTTSDHKPSFTQDGLWTAGERYHDQYGRETIDIETETNCLLVARAVGAKEIEANAHLISAAPDLYEAAQHLSDVYDEIWVKISDGEAAILKDAWSKMEAALSKARGES